MRKYLWFGPAVMWAALIFFLSAQNSLPEAVNAFVGMDKLVHATFYGVLTAWLLVGGERTGVWTGAPFHVAWAVVASLYGVSDELHQYFVPGRTCDAWDWLADTTGALACVALWAPLRRMRVFNAV